MTDLEKKLWLRVRRYVRFLKIVPFLRMVAVCNNLAFGRVDEKSDIDLFIVVRKGRLFTARLLVTFLLHVSGVRRHGEKVAGRFCLSFFVDDCALDLSEIAIEHDIYLAFWIYSMKPVLDDGVSGEFLSANSWVRDYFDEMVILDKNFKIGQSGLTARLFESILRGFFGDFWESRFRRWQLGRARKKAEFVDESASLIVDDHVLKFHNIDRRRDYRSLWFMRYGQDTKLNRKKFLDLSLG